MKKTIHLSEGQLLQVIRESVLLELKKIENSSPMKMVDYAWSPDKKRIEFDNPQEALQYIYENLSNEGVFGISHALFFGEGNIYAWRREVEDFIEKTSADPRAFIPFAKKSGFVEITDDKMVLMFLMWILEKYGELSLYAS